VRRAIALALGWTIVAACVGEPPAVGPSEGPARAGGLIVEGTIADIRTLQPVLALDPNSARAAQRIYAPLWRADPTSGELLPNLGRWSVAPDGLTFSWEIDAAAVWSDGRPVTGEDYLTTVKAVARSKKTLRKSNFQDIAGFAEYRDGKASSIAGIAVDGKRFSVTFLRAFCPALALAFGSGAAPLPTHVFARYTVDDDVTKNLDDAPENIAPLVASGPFLFTEWRRGDQLIMSRNPKYFRGAPLVDQHVLKVVADRTVIALQLRSGELNFATIEPKDLADIEKHPTLKVVRYAGPRYTYIGWNVRSDRAPALRDKRVRQALAYGLDLQTFVTTVLLGTAERIVAHHPPASWAFPSGGLNAYAYDRAAAERLIEQAGYSRGGDGIYAKEGKSLEFVLVGQSGDLTRETLLQVAVEQYRLLGVRVTPRLETFEALTDKLSTGTGGFDAWINGWLLGPDPDPYAIWHSSQIPDPAAKRSGFNFGGFSHPALDAEIERGRSGPCAVVDRQRAYATFNRILNGEQPYNFLFSPRSLAVVDARLRGFAPGAFDEMPLMERWWFAE